MLTVEVLFRHAPLQFLADFDVVRIIFIYGETEVWHEIKHAGKVV